LGCTEYLTGDGLLYLEGARREELEVWVPYWYL